MRKNAVMPMEDYSGACSKIREKIGTEDLILSGELSEKINEVYEAGKKTACVTLTGTASGDSIKITDISSAEHEMEVKVSGVEDLSTVKLYRSGKNLVSPYTVYKGASSYTEGIDEDTGRKYIKFIDERNVTHSFYFKENTQYTVSAYVKCTQRNTANSLASCWCCFWYSDGSWSDGYVEQNTDWTFKTTTSKQGKTVVAVGLYQRNYVNNVYVDVDTFMLEEGVTATEYEPYIEPTVYDVPTDGIVEGVNSIYPNTTLYTDTSGVVIDVTYNRDINNEDLSEYAQRIKVAGQRQSEKELWDLFMDNNSRYSIKSLFKLSGFEYIRPPYKIRPTSSQGISEAFTNATKLKKIEAKHFDFSQKAKGSIPIEGMYQTFKTCTNLQEIEDIGLQADYSAEETFYNCPNLKRIACIRSDEDMQYIRAFDNCSALEDITFNGTIGQNGLDFHWSTKLSHDSLMNIIGCLKDFRELTTFTKEVNLSYDSQTPTVITNGTLNEGEEYTWSYYDKQFPGWVVDNPSSYPSKEETWITSTATKIIVNGKEYIGFKATYLDYPAQAEGGYVIYVYQDGNEIKVYPEKGGYDFIDTIKLNMLNAPITKTITLGTENLAKLTDAEKAMATQKGWSLV